MGGFNNCQSYSVLNMTDNLKDFIASARQRATASRIYLQ